MMLALKIGLIALKIAGGVLAAAALLYVIFLIIFLFFTDFSK